MNRDPRLERYLISLEGALRAFPVSDRAEIVTEIKSHVMSALERDPAGNLESVLAALGEPEMVANRYLLERGLKPAKPPISPIVKWLIIGFLGTFAMLLIFAGFVMSRFAPLLTVNEAEKKVSILGGLVQVDGFKGKIHFDDDDGEDDDTVHESGSTSVQAGQAVLVKITNGEVNISTDDGTDFGWECDIKGFRDRKPDTQIVDARIVLDLSRRDGVECELSIPRGTRFEIDGTNGSIASFDSSAPANGYEVSLRIVNGNIKKEN